MTFPFQHGFTPMPYTPAQLLRAIEMVTSQRYVCCAVKLNIGLIAMVEFAQIVMVAKRPNPYKPSCRVIRQACIDLELHDKFNFSGGSG